MVTKWTAEPQFDGEELQERLSGLADKMIFGIEELHDGIAEASDKGKSTLRRVLATHEAVLGEVRKAQRWPSFTRFYRHTRSDRN